jgi:hypothetical protein
LTGNILGIGVLYGPALAILYLYRIDRSTHQANLDALGRSDPAD